MPKIDALQQNFIPQLPKEGPSLKKIETPQFSDTLQDMIEQVSDTQKVSGQATKDFIAGNGIDLHEAMARGQEAQLSFQFLMEVRNKLLEAYQEVQRMQV